MTFDLYNPNKLPQSWVDLRTEIRARGFDTVVVLGMGGSSLSSRVFASAFSSGRLKVIDSLHIEVLESLQESLDFEKTVFVVCSKSGATPETLALYRYFYEELQSSSIKNISNHFFAISDEPMINLMTILAEKNVGGRFSALHTFGLLPAYLAGIPIDSILRSAAKPRAALGHKHGKLSLDLSAFLVSTMNQKQPNLFLVLPKWLASFGNWFEQLIAESLGKDGTGIMPFVLSNKGSLPAFAEGAVLFLGCQDSEIKNLAGRCASEKLTTLHMACDAPTDLGGVMFNFVEAVCKAGELLGINPFDQPDVEVSKQKTREALDNRSNLIGTQQPFSKRSNSFVRATKTGKSDFVSILAFLPETVKTLSYLERMREGVVKSNRPVSLCFGPRYLHSLGQLFKGGPVRGEYWLLTGFSAHIKNKNHDFNRLMFAQAQGDFEAMAERGQKVCWHHLGENWEIEFKKLMRNMD